MHKKPFFVCCTVNAATSAQSVLTGQLMICQFVDWLLFATAETKADTAALMIKEEAAKECQRVWSASCAGQLGTVKRLLLKEEDADVLKENADVEDLFNGRSALSVASKRGHVDIVQLLIKLQADIESEDNDGRTPLRYACEEKQLDVLGILIHHKADVNHAKKDGGTPL